MAKWKCEVCGNEFENFHAQGFDNKIYCPLCYFKKENQELKLELSGYRQAILEDKDMLGLKEESEELKKQLEVGKEQYNDLVEEKEKLQEQLSANTLQLEEYKHKGLYNTCLPYSTGYKKAIKEKENQQTKFINYLEDEIEKYDEFLKNESTNSKYKYLSLKEILYKYKEIIGDDK